MRPLRLRDRMLPLESRPLVTTVAVVDLFADDAEETTRFKDAFSDGDRSWETGCERTYSPIEVRCPCRSVPVMEPSRIDRGGLRLGLLEIELPRRAATSATALIGLLATSFKEGKEPPRDAERGESEFRSGLIIPATTLLGG